MLGWGYARDVNTDLFTDDGELVVLELLKGLLLGEVRDDAGSVDHARAKEPIGQERVSIPILHVSVVAYQL